MEQETTNKTAVITGYALPYILAVAVASFIGNLIFHPFFFSITYAIVTSIVALIIPFAGIFISAYIINALAPSFGSTPNIDNAFKLVIYSYTASFLASIVSGLLPILFFVSIAGLYSFYIFWIGFTPMMKTPEDKKVGYAIVSILIMMGVYGAIAVTLGFITAAFFLTGVAYLY
ncbi:MAG: hypothetical protein COX07_09440 [Bacteroidetes bacterium CG23_combo_of_CG06-09_8_20_14_all_32_9]|nr:MAG: hypothetical protein COX07_09440 [Bacteroidetes bacterium CG23_combo_of_CG06-09_8_20_14_all_32_9]